MVFKKKMGLIITFKNLFFDLLDFIFPNYCLVCSNKIKRSFFSICDECLKSIESANPNDVSLFFHHNFKDQKLIKNFYSKYEFVKDGIFQQIVHHLKYNRKSYFGILFGRKLGEDLNKLKWFDEIDLIIPVPIHRIKKMQRGYNQSSMIAKGINQLTKKPINESVLKRIRNTETQTHLHLQERIENVKNAFRVTDRTKIFGKKILIVDDVCTTGSTVNEIARTLLKSGAKEVNLVTLAFVKEKDFEIKV